MKPPGRGAGVQGDLAGHAHAEVLESGVQFFPAAAGEAGWRSEDEERFRRADLARRFGGYRAADQHPPRRHQGGGLGPVDGQAPVDELDVEPPPGAQFSPAPRSTSEASRRSICVGRPILLVRSSFWPFWCRRFGARRFAGGSLRPRGRLLCRLVVAVCLAGACSLASSAGPRRSRARRATLARAKGLLQVFKVAQYDGGLPPQRANHIGRGLASLLDEAPGAVLRLLPCFVMGSQQLFRDLFGAPCRHPGEGGRGLA